MAVLATFEGGYDTVFPQGRLQVTVISHLFRQPGPIALLTYFVVQSAGFGLLVSGFRSAVVFRPRQWSARSAIPVAMVARPADHNLLMTTLAVEDAAVWLYHPVAPTKGLYRDMRKRDAACGTSTTAAKTLSRCPRGSGWCPGPPPHRGADPAISQSNTFLQQIDCRLLLGASDLKDR